MLFKHPHKFEAKQAIEDLVGISFLIYIAETSSESVQGHEAMDEMGDV